MHHKSSRIINYIHMTPHNLWMRAYRKAYINGIFCPIVPRRDKQRLTHYKYSVKTLQLGHKYWSAGSPMLVKLCWKKPSWPKINICCQMCPQDTLHVQMVWLHMMMSHTAANPLIHPMHVFTQKPFVILCSMGMQSLNSQWYEWSPTFPLL